MTRMLGFFACAKELVAERTRARIKRVTVINFVFINAARHDWLESLPLTIKKALPATMGLWSYDGRV